MSRVTVNVNGLSLVHEDSGGLSTATLPDVCFTPPSGAPTPFPNVARSRDLAGGSCLVRADGDNRIAVAGSVFARSTGGEAGVGGGITSGTTNAAASFLTHSLDVTVEGRGACRLTDKMLHNHGNTIDCGGLTQPAVKGSADGGAIGPGAPKAVHAKQRELAVLRADQKNGLDTNGHTLKTGYTKNVQHRHFVGRYLIAFPPPPGSTEPGTSNGVNTGLTLEEVERMHKGGLKVFAIWECSKYRALETITPALAFSAGEQDATQAKEQMKLCHGHGKPVYFTCDFAMGKGHWSQPVLSWIPAKNLSLVQTLVDTYPDVNDSPITGVMIRKYFEGIKKVLPKSRIGAYGAYYTIKKLFDHHLITYGWQWTFQKNNPKHGGKIDPRAQLHQTNIYAPQDPDGDKTYPWGVQGAGALDFDRAVSADFGAW